MRAEARVFGAAILSLRQLLGQTQEEIARTLGCGLRNYQRWEAGDTIPRGDWMLKILSLCPDQETHDAFFVDIREVGSKIPSISRPGLAKVEKEAPRPGGARASGKLASRYYKPNPNRR
jgi:transcriptional regulator with XRE-family HTH domain